MKQNRQCDGISTTECGSAKCKITIVYWGEGSNWVGAGAEKRT